jgi:hypothetical protein
MLEERAREIAAQEVDRANGIDQKAAGLMAAGLVLLAAGVAFATAIGGVQVGQGARNLWAGLLIVTLILILISLGFAISALKPRVFRIVLHMNELQKWPTVGYLDQDPTLVTGTLLTASVEATREARVTNTTKADRLAWAFRLFAAAVVAIVILAGAVAIRMTTETSSYARGREQPAEHPRLIHSGPTRGACKHRCHR